MPDAAPIPAPRRRPPPIFWALIILLIILLMVGIGAIVAYVKINYSPTAALWEAPWDMPEPERISSGLAVWSLAGTPPDLVYRQAMAAEELDTAAALTLLTPNLPANQRLGWVNVLAHRFIPGQRPADARVFLQHTADLAMVLPDLSDYLRAQILLQTAEGWAELGEKENAAMDLDQSLVIAQFSPELPPALRKNLLADIGEHYIQLGDIARGQAVSAIPVLDYAIDLPPALPLVPILQKPLTYPEAITNLQSERQQAARFYVDDWNQRGGAASAGAARTLENSLIDEDLGRQVYYQNQYAREDLSGDDRARVIFDEVTWLAIKYRAASGLYGTPLVANWTAERPAIGVTLRDAIVALHNQMNAYVATLPEAQQPAGRVAMDRLIMSWAVIGLYAGANLDVITGDLNQDIAAWNVTGVFPKAEVRGDRIHIELFYKAPQEAGGGEQEAGSGEQEAGSGEQE